MKANAVFKETGKAMREAGEPPAGDAKREASRRAGNPGHRSGRVSAKKKLHRRRLAA